MEKMYGKKSFLKPMQPLKVCMSDYTLKNSIIKIISKLFIRLIIFVTVSPTDYIIVEYLL